MKFYKKELPNKYYNNKKAGLNINIINQDEDNDVLFIKRMLYHNLKNAAISNGYDKKEFWLNGKYYGNGNDFTKKSWRKFAKFHVFLK